GRLITRRRVWEILGTNVVIKAVEAMGAAQKVQSLKLQNCRKTIFYPADWIAGVDYAGDNNDDNDDNDDDNENENDGNVYYDEDAELDDEEYYDRIDQAELDELLADDTNKQPSKDNNAN